MVYKLLTGARNQSRFLRSGSPSIGLLLGSIPNVGPSPPPPTGIHIFPTEVAAAVVKAQQNTSQWQSFKSRLDSYLPWDVGYPGYQGTMLLLMQDYALGYYCLNGIDSGTAMNYADKALGLMQSALNDYQSGVQAYSSPNPNSPGGSSEIDIQFLAQGDGSTTAFTLANAPNPSASFAVYFASGSYFSVKAVVRSSSINADNHGDPYFYITKISTTNSISGSSSYVKGVDWVQGQEVDARWIQWLTNNKPANGTTYYAVGAAALHWSRQLSGWSLAGNTLTFSSPPPNTTAVGVVYLYTAADGRGYQQTGNGYGGYNQVFLDTPSGYSAGYACRYLCNLASARDWLDGYSGFTSTRKAAIDAMLNRWVKSPYGGAAWDGTGTTNTGYQVYSPAVANYGAGEWGMTAEFAASQQSRGMPQSSIDTVTSWYTTYVKPQMTQALFVDSHWGQNYGTSKDGWWPEGYNYAKQSVVNLLKGVRALQEAGVYTSVSDAYTWATAWVKLVVHSSASQVTSNPYAMLDYGDRYETPAIFPERFWFPLLAALADDSNARGYANYALQNYANSVSVLNKDAEDLLFRDPTAAAIDWRTIEPLHYKASGGGVVFSRDSWTYPSVWFGIVSGNLSECGHGTYNQGHFEIRRGDDYLLVNALFGTSGGSQQSPTSGAQANNTLVIDSSGNQSYAFSQSPYLGNPGVVTNIYEAVNGASGYVVYQSDLHATYSVSGSPGAGGPCSEWVRTFVHLRPNYFFVHDRVTTSSAGYTKQIRCHAPNGSSTLVGNLWIATVGSSRLFNQVYVPSGQSVTATLASATYSSSSPYDEAVWNNTTQSRCRYLQIFQVGASSVSSQDTNSQITSGDSQLEGVLIGDQLVLVVQSPPFAGSSTYSFTGTSGHTIQHTLVGLVASHTYTLSGATSGSFAASGQGVLRFTTVASGGSDSLTITA